MKTTLELLVKLIRSIKSKRHHSYSRALLLLAAGLLSPSVFDFINQMADKAQVIASPESNCDNYPTLGITNILAVICIFSSIIIFFFFFTQRKETS